jgi:transcriptional regulator with XRE-family HTH domain
VERKDISPVWTRSFPVSKEPQTIGEHLRKRRFDLGLRQSEVARRLGVSERTLSQWETNKVYPTWPQQPALIAYLDHDPFTSPTLGMPKGNESVGVAIFSSNDFGNIGQQILKRRLEMKKNRKQCAKELGVSVKTLLGWETNRWRPSSLLQERIAKFLGPSVEPPELE